MKEKVEKTKVNFPMPAVLVSCQKETKLDIIAISWISMISMQPPTLMISFLKTRFSLSLIQYSGKFAVNVPRTEDAKLLNYCGTVTGQDHDKFKETRFTPFYSDSDPFIPMIKECPINILCKTVQTIDYQDRIVLFGIVDEVWMDTICLDKKKKVDLSICSPFVYWMSGGEYWELGEKITTVTDSKR